MNITFTSVIEMKKLKSGDSFWVNGEKHKAMCSSHLSGDSTCDEYIVYDENGNGWFESDFFECNRVYCPYTV